MITRVGLLVAASVAAYAVRQNVKGSDSPASKTKSSDKDEVSLGQDQHEEDEKPEPPVHDGKTEEEEEEVKLISGIINQASANTNTYEDTDEDELFPEFERLLSGEVELPLPSENFNEDVTKSTTEKERVYESEMANNANELERLRELVKELEDREEKLEGELLEYYGLREQEADVLELQKQLKIKTVEIDMLKITISSLEAERQKLHEEVAVAGSARKELEMARRKIKELQRQIQLEANQTKGHLLLLKQQVSTLQAKEEEAYKRDSEVERKIRVFKELEVEVKELKRKNIELQHEKRELLVKLNSAQAEAAALSSTSETEMVSRVREEVNTLRHANDDLLKQVEGLQMNRFSEVEELVYLRWVNACLRYELRNYQNPTGKISARDLNKNLSPKSQEKAKQLLMEYAGSERGQGDTDLESNFSQPSSPGSEDFDTASIDSSFSRYSSLSKKPGLLQKLKRWGGRSRDDMSAALTSPARSFGGGSPSSSRASMSINTKQRGPLESLMLRNASDSAAITSFGKAEQEMDGSGGGESSLNEVASSFQVMSRSVGVLEDKYPAYKDRHKLAMEREKQIKVKAEQARTERFGGFSVSESPKGKTDKLGAPLPPKLAQIKEKVNVNVGGDASDQGGDNKTAVDTQVVTKMKLAQIEKRAPRVPRPPPKASAGTPAGANGNSSATVISGGPPPPPPPPGGPPPPPPPPGGPPPPPPPPGSMPRGPGSGDKVHRAPEIVEFYQSLMKREAKKDTGTSLTSAGGNVAEARSSMIGEIENRSTFLLAVKADVETQGDFVESLANEVRAATFADIEDVVSFVNWLDEELSFLVDERAVLKHFDWPESKADVLREAAFEYQDLRKLERQITLYEDDPKLPCEPALKKMYKLLEKVEQSVYALLRTRDMAMSKYKEFGIPGNWLLDSGVVGKIKLSSVQLARKYMKRVATQLDELNGPENEPNREFMLLQGIRFAFRVHQFAGGFDAESMKAFEDLRSRVRTQTAEDQNQS